MSSVFFLFFENFIKWEHGKKREPAALDYELLSCRRLRYNVLRQRNIGNPN